MDFFPLRTRVTELEARLQHYEIESRLLIDQRVGDALERFGDIEREKLSELALDREKKLNESFAQYEKSLRGIADGAHEVVRNAQIDNERIRQAVAGALNLKI